MAGEEGGAGSDEIIHRRLADGAEHRLVKVFMHPGQLQDRLHQLGWQAHFRRDGHDVHCHRIWATGGPVTWGGSV